MGRVQGGRSEQYRRGKKTVQKKVSVQREGNVSTNEGEGGAVDFIAGVGGVEKLVVKRASYRLLSRL